jgi:HEAT repeat protein
MRTTAPADQLECLDEAIEFLAGLGAGDGESLLGENLAEIRSRLSQEDAESRLATLDVLSHTLDPAMIPDLEKLLSDDDRHIRSKSASCLHRLNAQGIAEKFRLDFQSMNLNKKYKAAEVLWILGDDSDRERVAGLLYDPRLKGVNPDIAAMFRDHPMSKSEIARLTRCAQVKYLLLERTAPDSIEEAFDGTRDELIEALEALLDEEIHCWMAFTQLKLLDWQPAIPRYSALLASDEEDPQVPALDHESARWLGEFVSMSRDARLVTRLLRVLARGGDQCKSTLLELIDKGCSGFSGEILPDMQQCFTREEILHLSESDNLKRAEFALRVIVNSDWSGKKDLIESRFMLALRKREDRVLRLTSSQLFEIDQESAKRLLLNTLASGAESLSHGMRGHFAKLLGELGGGEARLLLLNQLMENEPGPSKAAYNSLVKMGWSPSTEAETTLAALYKPDPETFETLGEVALPYVLTFLTRRGVCGCSILSYIQRVVPEQGLDQALVRTVLEGEWEYEAKEALPKLLARCPDVATDVLLELIPKQSEGSGAQIRYTEYISKFGNEKAISLFLRLLTSKYDHDKKFGAMALGRLRYVSAVQHLGAALPNIKDKSAYSAIVKSIAALGGEDAVCLLRALLPELQTKVLRTAAEKAITKWEKTRSKK